MSHRLDHLTPTFQKTIKHINIKIREAAEPDASMVKALADLTRAYLQLQGKESDPDLDGDPNYYSNMLKEAQRASQPQKERKPVKRKKVLVRRK